MDLIALRALSTQVAGTALGLGEHIQDENERNELWSHCGTIFRTWIIPMLTGATGNIIAVGVQNMMLGS